MSIVLAIYFFVFGAVLGSFYNVVGYRLPQGKSLISPPSHCPNCQHRLGVATYDSHFFIYFSKGECKHCHHKIPAFYTVFEFITGLLFVLAYLSYGLTLELLIALTFISMLIIIVVSDYIYMIINDSVLIIFTLILALEKF